jgi:hypothetical protein
VVDAAIGKKSVFVATRVGVMRATLKPAAEPMLWTRDPRFPRDTALVRTGPNGSVWAASRGCLWRIAGTDSAPTSQIATCFEGKSVLRDVVPRGSDVVVLVRGEAAGLYTVQDQQVEKRIDAIDPWIGHLSGGEVWVGTLGQGLWRLPSGPGDASQSYPKQTITAVGTVDGSVLYGTKEGGLFRAKGGEAIADLSPGWATHITEAKGSALVFANGHHAKSGVFYGPPDNLRPVVLDAIAVDPGRVDATGVWGLPDGRALIGTFRRGPVLFSDGTLSNARTDFRATVAGGAAIDSEGQLIVGMMGTGVYRFGPDLETFAAEHGRGGPVTDTIYLAGAAEGAVAIDFNGIAWRKPGGRWTRLSNPDGTRMVRVAGDDEGTFWGQGQQGRLFRYDDPTWTPCDTQGLMRLDGSPEGLVLMTRTGLFRPTHCSSDEPAIGPERPGRLHPSTSIAGGDWLASPGGVWFGKTRVSGPRGGAMTALAAIGDEALIVSERQVLRCTSKGCVELGPAAPGRLVAVGALASGKVWAQEASGTVLLLGAADAPVAAELTPWSRLRANPNTTNQGSDPSQVAKLRRVPWSREGMPQNGETDPRSNAISSGQPPPMPPFQADQPGDNPDARPVAPGLPPSSANVRAPSPLLVLAGLLLAALCVWMLRHRIRR